MFDFRTTEEKLRNSLTTTIVDGGKEERYISIVIFSSKLLRDQNSDKQF